MSWYILQRLRAFLGGEMSNKHGAIAGCWPPRLEPRGFEERVETRFVREDVRIIMDQLDLDEDIAEALLKHCDEDIDAVFDFVQDKYEEFESLILDVESKRGEDGEESKEEESLPAAMSKKEYQKLKSLHGKISRMCARYHKDGRFGMLEEDTIGQVVLECDCDKKKIEEKLFSLTNPPSRKRGVKEVKIWQWHEGKPGDLSAMDKNGKYLWKNYDKESNEVILKSYAEFKKIGYNSKPVRIKANGKTYDIDFKKMNQVSPNHKYERKIRRVTPSSVKLEFWLYVVFERLDFQMIKHTNGTKTYALEHRYESNRLQSTYAKKYGEWKRDAEAKMKDYGMKDNLVLLKKRSSEKHDDDEPAPPAPPLLKSKSTKGRSEMRQRQAEEGMAKYNFLIVVALEISNIVKRYTTHCIICGDPLSYPGAKPTVCNDKLCHYEYVQVCHSRIFEHHEHQHSNTGTTRWVSVWILVDVS